MLLYNMSGINCGHVDDNLVEIPEGYWLRPDNSMDEMTPVQFLDKIGPARFAVIWSAAIQNPAIAFPMMRGFAAQVITITESFPSLYQMEQLKLLPAGTAIEVWQ